MKTPKSVIENNVKQIDNLKAHFDCSETVYNNTKEITFKNVIESTDNFIQLTYYYQESAELWILCSEGTNDEHGDKTEYQIEAHFKQALKSKMKKAAKLKEVASVEITEMNDEQLDELFEVLEDQLNSCEVEDYQENCESSEDTHQLNNKIEYLEALIERSEDQEQIEQYKSTIQQMKAQIEQGTVKTAQEIDDELSKLSQREDQIEDLIEHKKHKLESNNLSSTERADLIQEIEWHTRELTEVESKSDELAAELIKAEVREESNEMLDRLMKRRLEKESAEPKVAIIGGRRFGLTQSVNKALASNLSHLSFHNNLSEIMIERKAEELLKLAERKYKESEKIENTSYLLGIIHAVEFLTGKIDENPADIKL